MRAADAAAWLMERGVRFEAGSANGAIYWEPRDGFYKSDGIARLVDEGGQCFLLARYGEKTLIRVPMDVVEASQGWHEFSKSRFAGWADPPAHWAALYAEIQP